MSCSITFSFIFLLGIVQTSYGGKEDLTSSHIELDLSLAQGQQAGPSYQLDECLNNRIDENCSLTTLDDSDMLRGRLKAFDRLDSFSLLQHEGLNYSDVLNDNSLKTLRQVLFIHRHGDRTPIAFSPLDPLKDEPFWKFHGYGQLTNRGKARVFTLGQIIRQRYDKFLGKSVNKNQRFSRSSGALRCIESGQMFLAGFLSLEEKDSPDAANLIWDDERNKLAHLWQPANILSVPLPIDGMLAEGAVCANSNLEFKVIDGTPAVRQIYEQYNLERQILENVMSFDIDIFYKWFWASSQIEVEKQYFEDKMLPKLLKIYDRLQEAGNLALGAFQSTKLMRRLRAGLLINDITNNMNLLRASTPGSTPMKFYHYSAHDLNLIILLGMLEQWDKYPRRPDYASNMIFELHQDSTKKEWFVKVFYQYEVPGKRDELHYVACEEGHPERRCLLDRFIQLMEPYSIKDWSQWMKECGNPTEIPNPYYYITSGR